MANTGATYGTRELRARRTTLQRDFERTSKMMKRYCFHRDGHGNHLYLSNVYDDAGKCIVPQNPNDGKNVMYSKTTVICIGNDGCRTIFEAAQYEPHEIDAMLFQLESMFEQIKWTSGNVDNFPGGEKSFDDLCIALDMVQSFCATYKELAKQRDNKNNKGNNKRPAPVGGFGTPDVYGGRGY